MIKNKIVRTDGRHYDELRPIRITADAAPYAEGSALVEYGATKVLCTASLDLTIPKWLQGSAQGWISAEYGMLPRSTHTRMRRDRALTGGRSAEISRLLGRALRLGVDLRVLADKQLIIDCDVIHADGGTRTAAITGGWVALALAAKKLMNNGILRKNPIRNYIAAVSVGLSDQDMLLDLSYEEDSKIETDMNVVMTDGGHFVEIQGTAEQNPFSGEQLIHLLELAKKGCEILFRSQSEVVGDFFSHPSEKRD